LLPLPFFALGLVLVGRLRGWGRGDGAD